MNEYAVQFKNVRKLSFGRLNNVSFSLPTGTIMGLMGPNGAGKTTVIRALTGIADYEEGEIFLFGRDIRTGNLEDRDHLGVVLDDIPYGDNYSAKTLEIVFSGVYSAWNTDLFHYYLERFRLDPTKRIKEYSKGMKLRLQLAVALSHDARLLVLDEPTANLDPAAKEEVMTCLMEYMQDGNRSILITTNTPTDIEQYTDLVTIIQSGSVVVSEGKDELLESYRILRCGLEKLPRINRADIIALRQNHFGAEALVRNHSVLAARYSDMIMDPATLDDILIFYAAKGSEVSQ